MSWLHKSLISIVLFVAIMAPGIPITPEWQLRPEIVLSLALCIWFLVNSQEAFAGGSVAKWFLVLGLSTSFSLLRTATLTDHAVITADFFEIPKLAIYYSFYRLGQAQIMEYKDIRRFCITAMVAFLLAALFALMQYLDIFQVNSFLTPLYASTQLTGIIESRRVVGTTNNPNDFALLSMMGICVGVSLTLWSTSRRLTIVSALTALACAGGIVLTSSRTVTVITPVALAFVVVRRMRNRQDRLRLFMRLAVVFGMLLIGLVIVLPMLPDLWHTRIFELTGPGESQSMLARFEAWEIYWGLFLEKPVFGWGPGKALFAYSPDNEWLMLLTRYGIVGCGIFILFGRSLFVTSTAAARRTSSPLVKGLNYGLQAFLLGAAVDMMSAGIFYEQQNAAVLLILLGAAHGLRDPRVHRLRRSGQWEVLARRDLPCPDLALECPDKQPFSVAIE
jgi:O-antigen ligase